MVSVSQAVYDLIETQRVTAAANAANAQTIIDQQIAAKEVWDDHVADLDEVLATLEVE